MYNQRKCNIMVKGEYIQEIYNWYEQGMLVVNRKYQRKLVWSLEEKRQLIDTIMNNYPVPIFLVVNNPEVKGIGDLVQKEIIDGLQRLEAIVSFINNEYYVTVDGVSGFFNYDVLPGKGKLIRDKKLVQRKPVLDFELCRRFISYQLPVSTIDTSDAVVEEIFKRINSTGRKLSSQSLRQAGNVGLFNDLVYRTATKIRGDFTEEYVLKLNDMSKYSINSSGLNYGLQVSDIFWTKQGIITEDGIRRSKDEEIIANMYSCVLNNYTTSISQHSLEKMYSEESSVYKKNEKALSDGRYAQLMQQFVAVFDDLIKVFDEKHNFSNYLFTEKKNHNKDLVFIVIFLAMVQLRSEYYVIDDYSKFTQALYHLADDEMHELITTSDYHWNIDSRNHLIERIKNRLKKYMSYNENSNEWTEEVLDILKKAEAEEQMYDFKIGLTDLRTGERSSNVIPKCIKTLTAMANTHVGKEGFVILGVSDKKTDADDFDRFYKTVTPRYSNYYITGVKNEAVKYYGDVAGYLEAVKEMIRAESSNVNSDVIDYILMNMRIVHYKEQILLVLSLKSDKSLFYDKELYVRHQSSLKKIAIGSPEFYSVFKS